MEKILNQLLEGQKQLFDGQKQLFNGQKQLFDKIDKMESRIDRMETRQEEQTIILKAVRGAQEIQKAELDSLKITTAHIEGDLVETKEVINNTGKDTAEIKQEQTRMKQEQIRQGKVIDNIGEDVNSLVRTAIQHEDDIRKLKPVK